MSILYLPKIGVSSCLSGNKVRYDGKHKRDALLMDLWGKYVQFIPVCPEVECGFGVPREVMHLAGNPLSPRLITAETGLDHTALMQKYSRRRVAEMAKENLSGFILKSKSPNCGIKGVKIHLNNGKLVKQGSGIFTRILSDEFPFLPIESEDRLQNEEIRENFIERIFAFRRWTEATRKKSREALIEFHTAHKLILLAHSPKYARILGKLTAGIKEIPIEEAYKAYGTIFMETMELKTTIKKNTNVLEHAFGYFKKLFSANEKKELREKIDDYHKGAIPLLVPITLINHYVFKYNNSCLKKQHYLNPDPVELLLKNHS